MLSKRKKERRQKSKTLLNRSPYEPAHERETRQGDERPYWLAHGQPSDRGQHQEVHEHHRARHSDMGMAKLDQPLIGMRTMGSIPLLPAGDAARQGVGRIQ